MLVWDSDILNFKKLKPKEISNFTASPRKRDFATHMTCRSEAEIPPRGVFLSQT